MPCHTAHPLHPHAERLASMLVPPWYRIQQPHQHSQRLFGCRNIVSPWHDCIAVLLREVQVEVCIVSHGIWRPGTLSGRHRAKRISGDVVLHFQPCRVLQTLPRQSDRHVLQMFQGERGGTVQDSQGLARTASRCMHHVHGISATRARQGRRVAVSYW